MSKAETFEGIIFEIDSLKQTIHALTKRVILLEEMYELLHKELIV